MGGEGGVLVLRMLLAGIGGGHDKRDATGGRSMQAFHCLHTELRRQQPICLKQAVIEMEREMVEAACSHWSAAAPATTSPTGNFRIREAWHLHLLLPSFSLTNLTLPLL